MRPFAVRVVFQYVDEVSGRQWRRDLGQHDRGATLPQLCAGGRAKHAINLARQVASLSK
jgi:hypothetical protein